MELSEYACRDAVGLAGLIRSGQVSAPEVGETARRAVQPRSPGHGREPRGRVVRCSPGQPAGHRGRAGAPLLTARRQPDPGKLEAVSRRVLALTREFTALDVIAALDAQNRLSRAAGAFFTDHDLLITPTLARLPMPHGTLRHDDERHDVPGWLSALFVTGLFTMLVNQIGQHVTRLPAPVDGR